GGSGNWHALPQRVRESTRSAGWLGAEEEDGLNKFQLHQKKSPICIGFQAVYSSVEGMFCGCEISRNREHMLSLANKIIRWVRDLPRAAELRLHAKISTLGPLDDSVAVGAIEENERPLALRSNLVHKWLYHDSATPQELSHTLQVSLV